MKSKLTKIFILSLALLLLFGSIPAFAYESYDTYTYSIDGKPVKSPPAYAADDMITSTKMKLTDSKFGGKALVDTADIFADVDGNVYLADKGNNRIVILDKYYKAKGIISDSLRADTFPAQWQSFTRTLRCFHISA